MINKWNYEPLTHRQADVIEDLRRYCSDCPPIAELLVRRGVETTKEADRFFSPAISDLHDPFLMNDMDKAVNRLNRAMGAKERIMVFGDYDVDGTTAVALVYKYLQNYYSNLEYYIPTRSDDGYGISKKSIDYAAENDVKLIIILDCHIKAIECFTRSGFTIMAKAIRRNPKKAIVGPITMRRVEKISGLKPSCAELPPPAMSRNPRIIIARQTAIHIMLKPVNGRVKRSLEGRLSVAERIESLPARVESLSFVDIIYF